MPAPVSPSLERSRARRHRAGAPAAVVILVLALLVAACSSTETTATGPSSSTAPPKTTAPPSGTDPATTATPSTAGVTTTAVPSTTKATTKPGAALPTAGKTTKVTILGTTSKFPARDAYVYLPPAYLADPTTPLPVLIMLHGTPGGPDNWAKDGSVPSTADAFAATNAGRTPIIVMPDFSGVTGVDTQCVDGRLGSSETYLTVDVPAYMQKNYRTTTGASSFGVAGLSAGGFCALMLAVRHPDLFRVFGDYSGVAQPELDPPGDALTQVFGGDQKAFDAHDPTKLLRQKSFTGVAGWFETGLQDPDPLQPTRDVAKEAAAAGMQTCVLTRPGGHDFAFWIRAFSNSLPWISMHLGVAPAPVDTHGASCSTP